MCGPVTKAIPSGRNRWLRSGAACQVAPEIKGKFQYRKAAPAFPWKSLVLFCGKQLDFSQYFVLAFLVSLVLFTGKVCNILWILGLWVCTVISSASFQGELCRIFLLQIKAMRVDSASPAAQTISCGFWPGSDVYNKRLLLACKVLEKPQCYFKNIPVAFTNWICCGRSSPNRAVTWRKEN